MNERSFRRLLIMMGASIVVILLLKWMLLRTATQVNAARERKAATAKSQVAPVPAVPAPASGAN